MARSKKVTHLAQPLSLTLSKLVVSRSMRTSSQSNPQAGQVTASKVEALKLAI